LAVKPKDQITNNNHNILKVIVENDSA